MVTDREFKRRFQFAVGLRFELFYGLQAVTDSDSRVHGHWRKRVLKKLPRKFHTCCKKLGACPHIWPVVADALQTSAVDLSFEEIRSEISKQSPAKFQRTILIGALHSEQLAAKLLTRKLTLRGALAKVPRPKQEWLTHIGLYPYDVDEPMIRAIELLIDAPEEFRRTALLVMDIFWRTAFKSDWGRLQRQFSRSIEVKGRLFEACSFAEFSKEALLRVEVDEDSRVLRATRGGYELAFDNLARGFLLPSVFNDKRYWTVYREKGKSVVYFPYFDPSITLNLEIARDRSELVDPQLDPALIFKALADTTRYGMVRIIAKKPASSAELARVLAISKATVSHHVHVLRDAGLISEIYQNGSVWLSLKRGVIEGLSALAVHALYDSRSKSTVVLKIRSHP